MCCGLPEQIAAGRPDQFADAVRQDVRRLERVMSLEILIAAPFFIALPLSPLAVPDDLGAFDGAFRFADLINLNHNLFPSLHATFGFTVGAMLGSQCGRRGRLLFAAWAAGIALSTLLTRQHLVLDVAGALGLTWWALRRLPEVQS